MKILIINGSLKDDRSHSMMVAKEFANGMAESANAEIEVIELSKMKIEHCTGCFCCWKVTPGQCAIHDDMDIIRQKLLESDVIILSFPLYFFGISSKMKTMIDRLLPFKLPYAGRLATAENTNILDFRYDFSDKKLVVVSSCAHASTDYVYDSVIKEMDLICGEGKYTTVFCPQGEILMLDQMRPIINNYLAKVKQAGEELAVNGSISDETHKKICAPLVPVRAVEKMMSGYWSSFPQ